MTHEEMREELNQLDKEMIEYSKTFGTDPARESSVRLQWLRRHQFQLKIEREAKG